MKLVPTRRALLAGASTLAMPTVLRAQGVTQIEFYFPVAVGGPITVPSKPGRSRSSGW